MSCARRPSSPPCRAARSPGVRALACGFPRRFGPAAPGNTARRLSGLAPQKNAASTLSTPSRFFAPGQMGWIIPPRGTTVEYVDQINLTKM